MVEAGQHLPLHHRVLVALRSLDRSPDLVTPCLVQGGDATGPPRFVVVQVERADRARPPPRAEVSLHERRQVQPEDVHGRERDARKRPRDLADCAGGRDAAERRSRVGTMAGQPLARILGAGDEAKERMLVISQSQHRDPGQPAGDDLGGLLRGTERLVHGDHQQVHVVIDRQRLEHHSRPHRNPLPATAA